MASLESFKKGDVVEVCSAKSIIRTFKVVRVTKTRVVIDFKTSFGTKTRGFRKSDGYDFGGNIYFIRRPSIVA